jgi:hypothetical protein
MARPLPPPTKDGDVTVYTIEVTEDELEERMEVPMQEKNTRLVVKLRPRPLRFSI